MTAFRVLQLDHVEMFVPNRHEAAQWHKRVLGLERSPSIQLLTTTRHIQSTFPIRMATAWRSPHTIMTPFARHLQNCASRPTSRQLAGSVRFSPAWIVANGEAG
jgi:hypothetical protein